MSRLYYPQCFITLQVVFDGFGGDDTDPFIVRDLVPRSCAVHLNGYNRADTFEVDFDAKRLPFSPESIRSCGVYISMFGADGLEQDPRSKIGRDSLLLVGLADNASISYSSAGRSFRMDGRDYTCLLLDKPFVDAKTGLPKRIPVGKSLKDTVQELANEATLRMVNGRKVGVDLEVSFIGSVDDMRRFETDKLGLTDLLTTRGRTTTTKKGEVKQPFVGAGHSKLNKKGIPVQSGNSYWDAIYRLCIQHGFIAYVRDTNIVISVPEILSLTSSEKLRRVAWGHDLSSIDIDRHLGKETVPQIVVRGHDMKTRKPLEGKFPKTNKGYNTGVTTKKEEVRYYTAGGVRDVAQLERIAKTTYFHLSRSEARLRFATKDLTDLQDKSLLDLRAGDPVSVKFDQIGREDARSNPKEVYAKMMAEGYDQDVAELVANNLALIPQLERPFYTKEVSFAWSITDGIVVDVEAVNFVSVERDEENVSA